MKYIFLCLLSIASYMAISQTVTIDYESWTPSNLTCSLFIDAVNVPATGAQSGSIEHQNLFGQIEYKSTDKSIHFQTQYSAPNFQGEVLRIAYNFKPAHNYLVYVTVSNLNAATALTGPYIRTKVTNTGGGGGTVCNGPENIEVRLVGILKQNK